MFAWLDARRGGSDLRSPVLVEQHKPYQQLHIWPSSKLARIVMLVRGPNCKLRKLQRQVWMIPIESAVLLDCHLHLYQQLLPLEAGPQPPNTTTCEIQKAKGSSVHDLANHFYARSLSSICSILVFIADEHGGLHNIAAKLACWANLAGAGVHYRQRPQVLIVLPNHAASLSSRSIEEMIISNILKYHNPFKEMTFSMAQETWRSCCGEIQLVSAYPKQSLTSHVRGWLKAAKANPAYFFDKFSLEMLLTSVCKQFAEDYKKPFSFPRAARREPIPAQLPVQIQGLARGEVDLKLCEDLVFTIARSLCLEANHSGLCSMHVTLVRDTRHAIVREWFAEFYQPILQQTRFSIIHVFIEQEFMRLYNEETLRKLGGSRLFRLPVMQQRDICLSCLANVPITLSCGHSICENCITGMNLMACIFCHEQILLRASPKPRGAGVRVLVLDGRIDEASVIAAFLTKLRSSLCGDLVDYFDFVICDGIGVFFAVMLFCLGTTVEDCRHHVQKLDRVIINQDKMTFAKSIQFSRGSLRPMIRVLFPKTRHIFTVSNKTLDTALSRLASRARSRETMDYTEEAGRFWPYDPISIVTSCGSDTDALPLKLLASLFYVECESKLKFYNALPVMLPVIVKCRLSTGLHFSNLTTKFRRERMHICFEDDGLLRRTLFCDDTTWADVQDGRPFRRVLYIKITSPKSKVFIQLESSFATGTAVISDCTAESLHINPQETRSAIEFREQQKLLESSLRKFI